MSPITATPPVVGLVELPLTFGPGSSEYRTINGRSLSRQRRRCTATGDPYWVVTEIPDPNRPGNLPREELFVSPGTSPAERFRDAERTAVGSASVDLRPIDEYRSEIEQLQREGKTGLAAVVRLQFPAPVVEVDPLQLFDFGESIGLSSVVARILKMSREEVVSFLVRHRRGDHGPGIGTAVGKEMMEETEWAPSFFNPLVLNMAAIASGSGLVRSVYPIYRAGVDDPPVGGSGHARDPHLPVLRGRDETISVATLLSLSREPRTIVVSSRDSVSF
jgi:hypothetical protein